jgi:transcriptional regulator with XRE-family HTH domain
MQNVVPFIAMDEFPNRINELRRMAGLTQEALANLLGTSKMNVSRYETGKQDLTIDWMRRFAEALGCEPAEILSDQDNPMRLRPTERQLITRFRSGSPDRQDDLRRVAETLIPYTPQPRDRSAA